MQNAKIGVSIATMVISGRPLRESYILLGAGLELSTVYNYNIVMHLKINMLNISVNMT